ncbi:BsuPI-related putative proteinase inhibitor [Thalassobacillus pellis]|uniref:BsuPI-related putative proteinase inhibitor n=1 Tax=Thalassobacillus pellis TaxID=748008 RepID=UPI00195FCA73|nr:BsuPI-related putative proteinase inhibitor [Thalassobacillus pellis]MBM7554069.1 hypothetical protein [Thalassobacillus pellis]
MKRRWIGFMAIVVLLMLAACSDKESQGNSGDEGAEEEVKEEEMKKEKDSETASTEVDIKKAIEQLVFNVEVSQSDQKVIFDFSLKNTGDKPYKLGFTSGQKYEIIVRDQDGGTVYVFSEGKMFTQALEEKQLKPGESLSFTETWEGEKKPGEYTAEVTMQLASINDMPIEAKPYKITKQFTVSEKTESPSEGENTLGDGEAFRNIKVSGSNGHYTVTGEARVFEGNFMYNVEDGHNLLVDNTTYQVDEGAPAWSEFTINIDLTQEQLPQNGTITLTLFQQSAKTGKPVNVNYIPLEQIN